MGTCAAAPGQVEDADERDATREIDEALARDALEQAGVPKLLLLGAGDSGKSTFLKQLTVIYGEGFSEKDRELWKPIILENVVMAAHDLARQVDEHWDELVGEAAAADTAALHACCDTLCAVRDAAGLTSLPHHLTEAIKTVWTHELVQTQYPRVVGLFEDVMDSAVYFFDKVEEIAEEEYMPTTTDVLRARIRTTGIVEFRFEIDGSEMLVMDVGGQRNERRKWVHCFEGVTAVLFVASLAGYDQKLFEDETQNRMQESLTLFEDIAHNQWFRKSGIVLLLNKRDLFVEKLAQTPLKQRFPDFEGDDSEEAALEYIENLYTKLLPSGKDAYVHYTCAVDTQQVHGVFRAVKAVVVELSLCEAGLVAGSYDPEPKKEKEWDGPARAHPVHRQRKNSYPSPLVLLDLPQNAAGPTPGASDDEVEPLVEPTSTSEHE